MKVIIFMLLTYGIVNIAVFGSIFEGWRNFWNKVNPSFFGSLMSCPMCLSFWVGAILSGVFIHLGYVTPMTTYGITMTSLAVFLDASFASGCVWIIHQFEEFLERGFHN